MTEPDRPDSADDNGEQPPAREDGQSGAMSGDALPADDSMFPPFARGRRGAGDEEHRNLLPNIDTGFYLPDERLIVRVIGMDDDEDIALSHGGKPIPPRVDQPDLSVTIYLADGRTHDQVEAAVEEALVSAGLVVTERQAPTVGSWRRDLRARLREAAKTPAGKEMLAIGLHALDQRVALDKDADITEKLMRNLGSVITALQPEQNAVVRMGAVLVVKANGVLTVLQLTAAQQLLLNHRTQLLTSPLDLLAALESRSESKSPAASGNTAAAAETLNTRPPSTAPLPETRPGRS